MRPVVRTVDLRKAYEVGTPREVEVLKGIDLEVKPGEFVAVMGQSGSGKTTLLNVLGALDVPTAGKVHVDGVDLGTLDSDGLAALRSAQVGFVFQFHHLLEEFTCLENALMPVFIARGDAPKEDVERVRDLLERLALSADRVIAIEDGLVR